MRSPRGTVDSLSNIRNAYRLPLTAGLKINLLIVGVMLKMARRSMLGASNSTRRSPTTLTAGVKDTREDFDFKELEVATAVQGARGGGQINSNVAS